MYTCFVTLSQRGSQDQSGPEPDAPTRQLHPDHAGANEYSPAAINSGQVHTSPVLDLQVSTKRHGMTEHITSFPSIILIRVTGGHPS